jgi:hypothetical protein
MQYGGLHERHPRLRAGVAWCPPVRLFSANRAGRQRPVSVIIQKSVRVPMRSGNEPDPTPAVTKTWCPPVAISPQRNAGS